MSGEKLIAALSLLKHGPTDADKGVTGSVLFTQAKADGAPVRAHVKLAGLAPNSVHGFHVHALGDLSKGCASAGGHFNPLGAPHGGPKDAADARHAGDLGNVEANGEGVVDVVLEDAHISLKYADKSCIVGRSVIVHADADDLGKGEFPDSKTTGHAGARIACGVIGLADEVAA
jgi:Cu-Zn family superoxide dismutase